MYDDEDEAELNDWEDPEPDNESESFTAPCPKCGQPIDDEVEQCPYCREFVERSTSIWSDRPWWFLALGGLGILAMILAMLFAF